MKKVSDTFGCYRGFSLAEVLAAMVIGAMILVAVLGIYTRVENNAEAVTRKLDSFRLPSEVLQHITEDIDRMAEAGTDVKITIRNKTDAGRKIYRMEILKTIDDSNNRQQAFEEIIWQNDYDPYSGSFILYRSHGGIALEDKLLDVGKKEKGQDDFFVPICEGVTFFKIQVPKGNEFLDEWTSDSLPRCITVTISFAKPFENPDNSLDVPEEEKIVRTITIDRIRKMQFEITVLVNEDSNDSIDDETKKAEDSNEGRMRGDVLKRDRNSYLPVR